MMGIKNLVNDNELRQAVKLINNVNIPSPPQLLLDLKNELSLLNPDAKKITAMISKDIGLASQLIKVLNSPFYGLEVEVTSIEHAISLLGLEKFNSVILQPAYHQALSQTVEGFSSISEHSHNIGLIAELIANELETDQQGLFYLAGLFHDVGALVLALNYPDYLELSEKNTLHPITLPLWEKEKYQVSHAAIGVLLAKKWGLSNTICNAIYLHHHLYATYRKEVGFESVTLAAVLQLADYFSSKKLEAYDVDASVEYGLIYNNAVKELMLTESNLAQINEEISLFF
ncbi:MAG: HDOD domain-containing protein [Pseudomonadota bacterium]